MKFQKKSYKKIFIYYYLMKKLLFLICILWWSVLLTACNKWTWEAYWPAAWIEGYEAYTLSWVQTAVDNGDDVILYVWASRCPTCNALQKDIEANIDKIPAELKIFTIDFDTMDSDLKKRLEVTSKHTTLYLNHDWSTAIKNVNKEFTLDDILEVHAEMHEENHWEG